MQIEDLRTFLAVVEQNGFRRASRALYVSQPVVTKRVERLESELGIRLVERGAWGIRLTNHGKTLASRGPRLLRNVEDLRLATVGAGGASITLGCSATAAGSYLAAFLSAWIPDNPTTRLTMVEDGAVHVRRLLEDGQCDAAIVSAPSPSGCDSLMITTVRLAAVLPTTHRLAVHDGPVDIAELHRERVLLTGSAFLATEILTSACRLRAIEPDIVYECSVGQTLMALAEAGLGIAIVGDNVDRRGFSLPARELSDENGHPLAFDLEIAWRTSGTSDVVRAFAKDLARFTRPLREQHREVAARRGVTLGPT